MIAARDRSGRMLSVFHNRRWDWDFVTIRELLAEGLIGRPLLVESSVCRHSAPRSWRGQVGRGRDDPSRLGRPSGGSRTSAWSGPCRRLVAWVLEAPWEGIDSGGHGRIVLEFDRAIFQAETSRICWIDRPRWWILGTDGGFVKYGIDPQEDALRAGDIDRATEPESHQGILRRSGEATERGGRDPHPIDPRPLG